MFENKTDSLDKELEPIDIHSKEGQTKIAHARKVLPVHYQTMMDAIGGNIEPEEIDYNRLPTTVVKLAKLLDIEAPSIGQLSNIMTTTLGYTRLLSQFRPYILDPSVSKKTKIPVNVYAINISPSGSSKDMSMNLSTEILSDAEKVITDQRLIDMENKAKRVATKKNREAIKKEKPDIKEEDIVDSDSGWELMLKPISAIDMKGATSEGLLAELANVEKSGDIGNLFMKISELATELRSNTNLDRTIMVVSELFDAGQVAADVVKTAELKVAAIEGIGISMLAHTSPSAFITDPKLVEKLKTIIGTYMGRRAFFLITSLNDATASIEISDDLESEATLRRSNLHKHTDLADEISKHAINMVSRLLLKDEHNNRLTLSDGAAKLYSMYYLLNTKYRRLAYMLDEGFNSEGLLPEIAGRHWRASKLAGIWSLMEGESVISTKTMANAIYFTELTGRGLRKILALIDLQPFERFVKATTTGEIGKSIRFDTLLKQKYVHSIRKDVVQTFLVAVNSALKGTVLCTPDFEKNIINIKSIEQSTGEYGTSTIKFNKTDSKEYRKDKSFKGFKHIKHKLSDLVTLLKGDFAYSPFEFKDGMRSNDNIISETNYIVFDVDESEIPMEIWHETYLSGTSHIISTTSDSTNKHKFRLLLPIAQKIGSDKNVYKYVLNRIADELMLTIDPQSTVLSQPIFSYNGAVVLDNLKENIKPMDISDILQDAAVNVRAVDYSTTLTKAEQKKEQGAMKHDFEDTFAFAINAKDGMGSITLFGAVMKMKRAGLDDTSIEALMHRINGSWSQPMPLPRLNKIIRQGLSNR